ncbi:hypothetical protein J1N35_007575 [Gossypium stocksii]|uniref:Retrovirus-related Pol polyprotein from transposon TNT 1-94 n=1 Tax=Gossypium stocksii TaxID=47602 RepID=A0A9D3W7T1_9ROSI|nr:hypothetical protein J1N35_007575 [Gossypium stocksii]
MTRSLANRLVLKQRLYMLRMVECESIRNHISEFVTYLNDLKNLEVEISDRDQAMLLLCFLPSFYKTFRETLIYDKDNLSFEDVKQNLLSKHKLDNEFGLNKKPDGQVSALVVRGRQQSKKLDQNRSKTRPKSRNRDKECCCYKKNGHIKSEGYKLQNKIRKDVENDKRAK